MADYGIRLVCKLVNGLLWMKIAVGKRNVVVILECVFFWVRMGIDYFWIVYF